VVIGLDTRESGPWLAEQVAGGLARAGVNARFAGIITTPGVAYLTRTGPYVAGVMISASHNPYCDNGLKVIGHSGYKLPDATELELEQLISEWLATGQSPNAKPLEADPALDDLYADYLAGTVSGGFPLRSARRCGRPRRSRRSCSSSS
jgi:phosphoglucosamine mutase